MGIQAFTLKASGLLASIRTPISIRMPPKEKHTDYVTE
jgi:hypothetical protein